MVTAAPASPFPGAARAKFSNWQLRIVLRQRNALKRTDDVVWAFLGKEAFVIPGAEVPVRSFVIIVAKESPHAADHDDAAHAVVPVVSNIVETQVGTSVGTFEPDVVIKYYFRQPGDFLCRFNVDFAGTGRVIAQRAEGPFHVDDAPVIGG